MRHLVLVIILVIAVTAVVGGSRANNHFSFAAIDTPVVFKEIPSSESKITWVHDNGKSEAHHLPETCGGGGVFFDYNNDGLLDIYLVNSGPSDFFTPKTPIKNALYRNNGDGTFTDVADKAGVGCGQMGHFGMGAAAADFD